MDDDFRSFVSISGNYDCKRKNRERVLSMFLYQSRTKLLRKVLESNSDPIATHAHLTVLLRAT